MISEKEKIQAFEELQEIEHELQAVLDKHVNSLNSYALTFSCMTVSGSLKVLSNKILPEPLIIGFMLGTITTIVKTKELDKS